MRRPARLIKGNERLLCEGHAFLRQLFEELRPGALRGEIDRVAIMNRGMVTHGQDSVDDALITPRMGGIQGDLAYLHTPTVVDALHIDAGHHRTSTCICDGSLPDLAGKVRALCSHSTADCTVGRCPAASTSSMPLPRAGSQLSTATV